jgi:hypothetical protein
MFSDSIFKPSELLAIDLKFYREQELATSANELGSCQLCPQSLTINFFFSFFFSFFCQLILYIYLGILKQIKEYHCM